MLTVEKDCADYSKDPSELPVTVPIELDMLTGSEHGVITDDIWYVPNKFYSLTKIRLWKSFTVSGFEVTYEAEIEGYPPISHLFGTTKYTSHFEEIDLRSETKKSGKNQIRLLCLSTTSGSDGDVEFAGISLNEYS